jgi:hypothetical protein
MVARIEPLGPDFELSGGSPRWNYDPVWPGHPMRAATFDDFDERSPQRVHSTNVVSSASTD